MPRRSGCSNLAIVGGIALGVALALLVGHWAGKGFPYPGKAYKEAYQRAYDYRCEPARGVAPVVQGAVPNDTVREGPKPHEQYDLCQQWRVAQAAERALVVSWVQLGFGFFGIIGLIATVVYTSIAASAASRSAAITAEIFVNDERAWMTTTVASNGPVTVSADLSTASFSVDMENANIGKTPALNVRTWMALVNVPPVQAGIDDLVRAIEDLKQRSLSPEPLSTRMVLPNEKYNRGAAPSLQLTAEIGDPLFLRLAVCITYNLLHDTKPRHTLAVYAVRWVGGPMLARSQTIPREQVQIGVAEGGHAT